MASANAIQELKKLLEHTTTDLNEHVDDLEYRLRELKEQGDNIDVGGEQMLEEAESAKQCLTICAHASEHVSKGRTNVFEEVSAAEDAHQAIVSTVGDLISARRVTAAAGATQLLGQMSDSYLLQLSKIRGVDLSNVSSEGKILEHEDRLTVKFRDRHGAGNQL